MVAADRAGSSGQIFNNDGLSERGFHAVGQYAAQRVGRAACRKRHNDSNREVSAMPAAPAAKRKTLRRGSAMR